MTRRVVQKQWPCWAVAQVNSACALADLDSRLRLAAASVLRFASVYFGPSAFTIWPRLWSLLYLEKELWAAEMEWLPYRMNAIPYQQGEDVWFPKMTFSVNLLQTYWWVALLHLCSSKLLCQASCLSAIRVNLSPRAQHSLDYSALVNTDFYFLFLFIWKLL